MNSKELTHGHFCGAWYCTDSAEVSAQQISLLIRVFRVLGSTYKNHTFGCELEKYCLMELNSKRDFLNPVICTRLACTSGVHTVSQQWVVIFQLHTTTCTTLPRQYLCGFKSTMHRAEPVQSFPDGFLVCCMECLFCTCARASRR